MCSGEIYQMEIYKYRMEIYKWKKKYIYLYIYICICGIFSEGPNKGNA